MKPSRMLAAGLLAAFSATATPQVQAADLDGYRPYDQSDYDDPYENYQRRNYADHDQDDQDAYPNSYDDNPYEAGRYRGSYKDSEYLAPMNRPPRYAEDRWRGRDDCAPRWQIRQRMMDAGWRQIRRLHVTHNLVVIRAHRPSGRAFDLKLDRCTGDIVDRRPAYIGRFNGYSNSYGRYRRTY